MEVGGEKKNNNHASPEAVINLLRAGGTRHSRRLRSISHRSSQQARPGGPCPIAAHSGVLCGSGPFQIFNSSSSSSRGKRADSDSEFHLWLHLCTHQVAAENIASGFDPPQPPPPPPTPAAFSPLEQRVSCDSLPEAITVSQTAPRQLEATGDGPPRYCVHPLDESTHCPDARLPVQALQLRVRSCDCEVVRATPDRGRPPGPSPEPCMRFSHPRLSSHVHITPLEVLQPTDEAKLIIHEDGRRDSRSFQGISRLQMTWKGKRMH